jgi:hypothetical protein
LNFSGYIWTEIKQLWDEGAHEYVHDMWNILDFVTNSLYIATLTLRVIAYLQVIIIIVKVPGSWIMDVVHGVQQYFSYIVAVSLIGVAYWSTQRKPPYVFMPIFTGGSHGHDHMVVGFKTTNAISAYHN